MQCWIRLITSCLFLISITALNGQCELILDETDEFDSTRTIVGTTVNVGYTIPSNFQTVEGFKMIEEGKILFSYTENDTLSSFFMSLALAERSFRTIESGKDKILIKLPDGEVLGLFSVSDRGEFDKNTNMRIYNHTCVIPVDLYYKLALQSIEKIRIYYNGYKRTIELTSKQQEALQTILRCVGEAAGLFPNKP